VIYVSAHVRMTETGRVHVERLAEKAGRQITREVFREIQRRVPVDTGELLDSIGMSFAGTTGTITVGADYWASVEYGSRPHIIRSTGPWPLRNRETGQVFGRVVHHPGTPAQPFIRPAVFKHRRLD
jgi:hypothetical protein